MGTPCPDRTAKYLRSLQDSYRQNEINVSRAMASVLPLLVVPANPFRVLLQFTAVGGTPVTIGYYTDSGIAVVYQAPLTTNILLVTQQMHFMMPTYSWYVTTGMQVQVNGVEVVKQ